VGFSNATKQLSTLSISHYPPAADVDHACLLPHVPQPAAAQGLTLPWVAWAAFPKGKRIHRARATMSATEVKAAFAFVLAKSQKCHKPTWLERQASFAGDVSAFLGYGAFHQWHHEHERKRYHGENPEAVEIGKGGGLLLA
jgi:hypothetical protein